MELFIVRFAYTSVLVQAHNLKNRKLAILVTAICINQLTVVQPLFMLCRSRWLWAQKSRQAVTPENGRPGLKPSLHSEASLSN